MESLRGRTFLPLSVIAVAIVCLSAGAAERSASGTLRGHVWTNVDPEAIRVAIDVAGPQSSSDGTVDHEFVLFTKDTDADIDGLEFADAQIFFWPEKLVVRSRPDHRVLILALSAPRHEMGPSVNTIDEAESSADRTANVTTVNGYGLNHSVTWMTIDELRAEWAATKLRVITNAGCQSGGCGASGCGIDCPKGGCTVDCGPYFYACCNCQLQRGVCSCEINAGC